MAEMDDYESLPEDTPLKVTAIAGAFAGIAEHVALYPVDSVKVRSNMLIMVQSLSIWNNNSKKRRFP